MIIYCPCSVSWVLLPGVHLCELFGTTANLWSPWIMTLHLTDELMEMDGGLEKVKCPQATGRAGIWGQWQWGGICVSASCHRLCVLYCGKWALYHSSKTFRRQEPHPQVSHSNPWPDVEMGEIVPGRSVMNHARRDKTEASFGLNVTWDFILPLLLGPRLWPILSPNPYTVSFLYCRLLLSS